MVQICSKCLFIPVDKIHLNDTSSDKVPNASSTAASISSDLYGMAIKVNLHDSITSENSSKWGTTRCVSRQLSHLLDYHFNLMCRS